MLIEKNSGNKYEVGELLSSGFCGEIRKGICPETGEEFLIKLIKDDATHDEYGVYYGTYIDENGNLFAQFYESEYIYNKFM